MAAAKVTLMEAKETQAAYEAQVAVELAQLVLMEMMFLVEQVEMD